MKCRNAKMILFILAISFSIPQASIHAKTDTEHKTFENFTHVVFAESGSLSYCPYCPAAAAQLYQIYSSEEYPFLYVTLVYDKNPKVRSRCEELDIYGFPTVVFDGGYTRVIGEQGNPQPYISAIEDCGERDDIYSVELDVVMKDMNNGYVQIDVDVYNKDTRRYSGVVRVYITEIESRWNDAAQKPYHFATLEIMMDGISLASGEEKTLTFQWDTSEWDNIDLENIMVVVAAFDSHTDYVDNASFATIYSAYPDTKILSGPSGVINETTVTFTWIGEDRDTPTEQLLYSYKLEPLDSEWSEWTTKTTVTYTNLNEGWYTFMVKSRNPEGEEDPTPATSTFAVNQHHPPQINIVKPGRFMIINDKQHFLPLPIVIGDCSVVVNATDEAGIDHIDFYINGKLRYQDSYPPYQYTTWYDKYFFKVCTIKTVAYDTLGNHGEDTVRILKIF